MLLKLYVPYAMDKFPKQGKELTKKTRTFAHNKDIAAVAGIAFNAMLAQTKKRLCNTLEARKEHMIFCFH